MGKLVDVYIAGSLRYTPRHREWWSIYEKIGKLAESFGFKTYVPHINAVNDVGASVEGVHEPNLDLKTCPEVFKRNWDVIHDAKLIIAEVTNSSTCTGVEIGLALKLSKPIIRLARKDVDVTSMVLGPLHIGEIDLIRYEDEEDTSNQLKDLLSKKFKNLVE